MEFDLSVDLSGLRCPLPVLRTKKALSTISSGQILRVLTTDLDAVEDIPMFVQQAGHCLLKKETGDNGLLFYIQKR